MSFQFGNIIAAATASQDHKALSCHIEDTNTIHLQCPYPTISILHTASGAAILKMQTVHPSPKLRGPDRLDAGFIQDFIQTVSKAPEEYLQHGDVFNFPISCEGYSAAPATAKHEGENALGCSVFTAVIVLTPHPSTKPPDLNTRFIVDGLKTMSDTIRSDTLSFTLSDTDLRAKNISFDADSGEISLTVFLNAYPDESEHDEHAIYVQDEIDSGVGKDSQFMKDVWERYESDPRPEGVLVQDSVVPECLVNDLKRLIRTLAEKEVVDWHPGSDDCVRDLIHPSLYPFVKGESKLTEEGLRVLARIEALRDEARKDGENMENYTFDNFDSSTAQSVVTSGVKDRWGRQYEDSIYQWLPTVFKTSLDGSATIDGYINNLDRHKYGELYTALARLFEHFLPMFEQVYAYAKAIQLLTGREWEELGDNEDKQACKPDIGTSSLRGRSLHVITKIVDYTLRDDSAYVDGAFHVEGMSSDHILATGSYTLSRDDGIEGGELIMRRGFLATEALEIYMQMPQLRHWKTDEIVETGIRPLGKVPTKEGRLIVFPNAHIHKLTKISCGKGLKDLHRRVIVFWLVDPDADVIKTEHLAPQQGGEMSRDRALWHRLELMKERSKYKGKFNVDRKIQLCEH